MIYSDFHEEVFKRQVGEALTTVRRVLEVDRNANVRLAEDVEHDYGDKFKLADLMTNTSIVSLMSVMEEFGLTKEVLRDIGNTPNRETTLRFCASESCKFVKEEVVDEPLPLARETKETTTVTTEFGTSESTTQKSTIEQMVKRVTKQQYEIETNWELSVYSGTNVDNSKIIKERTGVTFNYVRSVPNKSGAEDPVTKPPPYPTKQVHPPVELPLTWLLQQMDAKELKSHFSIDISPGNADTKTPRRNPDIEQAFSFFGKVRLWAEGVGRILQNTSSKQKQNLHVLAKKAWKENIFVPILPLLVQQNEKEGQSQKRSWTEVSAAESDSNAMVSLPQIDRDPTSQSPMLSVADTVGFLNEHTRTLLEKKAKLREEYPGPENKDEVFSSEEAMMYALSLHVQELVDRFVHCIQYIETMLEDQLVTAIGKRVSSTDLDKFMRYHNEKLLKPVPKRFCHTIRRPDHYPDGILSIEESVRPDDNNSVESISTHVREIHSTDPIEIPLNAATTISLTGKTYLHGWLNHRFGHGASASVRLCARARQFSSFVLLVGTMTNQNRMEPKDGIILRNKDEVFIPLLLNEIPTAKKFKHAIGSLSHEQQRFAKSFRSMQLDSSILGVCVIQIKPQLENLLGLPQDSLTKEMKLTEDLTELFVEYQVPSDLVSCDQRTGEKGDDESNNDFQAIKSQVANVREHVKSILDVIASQKKDQLEDQVMRTDMALEEGIGHRALGRGGRGGRTGRFPRPRQAPGHPLMAMMAKQTPMNDDARYSFQMAADYEACCAFQMAAEQHGATLDDENDKNNDGDGEDLGFDLSQNHSPDKNSPSMTGRNCANTEHIASEVNTVDAVDIASIPKLLDRVIELHDSNSAIRSTTITTDSVWTRNRQKNLLSKTRKETLDKDQIASEKSKAFDLLDALSRSGSLSIPFSEVHVLICATHRFEKNVMETVIQDNINPIEKLEMSTLLMASTTLGIPTRELVRDKQDRDRLEVAFPLLLDADGAASEGSENFAVDG